MGVPRLHALLNVAAGKPIALLTKFTLHLKYYGPINIPRLHALLNVAAGKLIALLAKFTLHLKYDGPINLPWIHTLLDVIAGMLMSPQKLANEASIDMGKGAFDSR